MAIGMADFLRRCFLFVLFVVTFDALPWDILCKFCFFLILTKSIGIIVVRAKKIFGENNASLCFIFLFCCCLFFY